jgi:hypothetical protein
MTLDPQSPARSTAVEDGPERRRQVRKAALANTIGTTIGRYDSFLHNTATALVVPAGRRA